MPPPSSLTQTAFTIAAGESLSPAVDCSPGTPVFLLTPASWDPAGGVSFQASADGVVFADVMTNDGSELVMSFTAGAGIMLPGQLHWAASLKMRSGTRNAPIIQAADRTFTVILQT